MGDDVTSGLPDDVTIRTVTLTIGHGQMPLGCIMMSRYKLLIWVPTDITVMMVALTA